MGPATNRKGGARSAAAGFRLPLSRKTAASRAEASSAPSRRSAHHLVARTTVGAPVGGFRRRMKTRNMLLQPPSRGHEVREPHPAFVPMSADNHRQPAARVRHALPNCTTADDSLVIRRRLPNHMILTATRVACLCRHQWPLQWLWSQPWQRQRQHQRQHQRRQRRRGGHKRATWAVLLRLAASAMAVSLTRAATAWAAATLVATWQARPCKAVTTSCSSRQAVTTSCSSRGGWWQGPAPAARGDSAH